MKISVIMPTYNDSDSIVETLDSLKNQTYNNWELIIIDDGSSDNTKEIVASNNIYKLDPSKITVLTKGVLFNGKPLNGHQLGELLLDKYHIIVEMVARDYVLGMTSIADTKEGFDRFANGLIDLDKELTIGSMSDHNDYIETIKLFQPFQAMTPYRAMELETEVVDLQSCQGRISANIITLYPPGIPLIVPGERIDQEFIEYIGSSIKEGLTVTGLIGDNKLIEVIMQE